MFVYEMFAIKKGKQTLSLNQSNFLFRFVSNKQIVFWIKQGNSSTFIKEIERFIEDNHHLRYLTDMGQIQFIISEKWSTIIG